MTKIQLYAGGKRERVSKEQATQLVQRWTRELEAADGVFRVDLSCRSWALEAFDVIQPFLANVAKDVKYAVFADIIAGLMTDEGLAVTEALAKTFAAAPLVDIELSDNAMGPRGLIRLESMIVDAPLQRLYLGNCGLSYESMKLLKEWLTADNNRIAGQMRELLLDRNMTGPEGAKEVGEILANCKKLEYFSHLGCRTREGTIHLAVGLQKMVEGCDRPALCRLDIDDCTFGEEECAALAGALSACSNMRHLELPDAGCGVDGLKKIVDALTSAGAKMTHLGLGTCIIVHCHSHSLSDRALIITFLNISLILFCYRWLR